MDIFISCGEPSGDVYAGELIDSLKTFSDISAWGMLGPKGAASGGEPVWGYESLHLMGITEVLPAIPRIIQLQKSILNEIINRKPDCVVVTDSPDFHLRLVSKLRKAGFAGKIIYLVTPTVWAWRSGRAKILRDCCDLCLPLFSFEHEWLLKRGVNSAWTAHPLVRIFKNYSPPAEFVGRFGEKKGRVIAFMPGSRHYDIRWHIEELIKSALEMRARDYFPVFSIAPGLHGKLRENLRSRLADEQIEYCEEEGRALLSIAEASVGVSGTISVEAMLLRRFMTVVYNGNFAMWLVWKTLIHAPYISIPNILACGTGNDKKAVFPELIKKDMSADKIVHEICSYLENADRKKAVDGSLSAAVAKMGNDDAGKFWAEQILKMVRVR
ncbi:MAG: hypothetical protein FWG09_00330 [Synergistaceae bacterium]|nr:hypothetical protein [Synergistaceae bacterium]